MKEDKGLITLPSNYTAQETLDRITELLTAKGFTIFTYFDHQQIAKRHGRHLPFTTVVVFGNPAIGGTGLMQDQPTVAIDLPAKILVWEDKEGDTYITYNDFEWMAQRHELTERSEATVEMLKTALAEISREAAGL